MKAFLLVVALAVTPACGKKNDAHILEHEAVSLVKYYQPKLEALETRVQAIWKRGSTIPGNLPDVPELGRRLQESRETLTKLTAIIGKGPDGKSAVEKQADAAAKDNNVDDLKKLVHDTEVAVDTGLTVINNNLDSVESWIEQYDRKTLAMMAPAKPVEPVQDGTGAPAPGAAEPGAPEGTGQPPPAAAPTTPPAKGEQPKAEQPKAEQPKAAQPKAAQPKAEQPKAEQPKQPAPAQPKQPAPAPAQPKQP